MTSSRWRRLEGVLQRALQHDTAERRRYLEQDCPSELRADVEAILRAEERAGDFLERPIVSSLSELSGSKLPLRELPWDHLGPYRLLRVLGHGGMGSVYLAVRDDGHLHQIVAIKVVRPNAGGDEALRRFRNERQILARLEHPNIARIHDGGATDDGSLYLVLEYVAGQRIDLFCTRRQLSLRQRLDLVLCVCSAVSTAQRNLIIHRDLKPANVLVTEEGVPKLLDFGIAKILEPGAFPHAVEVTASGLHPMTLQYASPEQLLGEPITTATDVYALGLLLYELLTGSRPYELGELSPAEVERVVCELDPPRPSTTADRSSAGPVRPHQLRGDLDNILLKALAKDPRQRYGSSRQLAEDIERYLEGRPVVARTVTWWGYRAGKLIRRHVWGATVVALFLLTVLGFVLHASIQAAQLELERDQARQDRDHAEQVSSFLVDLFSEADPSRSRGQDLTAREVLDRGVARIGPHLDDQPEKRAGLLETMATVYDELGLWQQSIELLEEALALRRRGSSPQQLATTLGQLAELRREVGDIGRADVILREAFAIRQQLGAEDLAIGLVQQSHLRHAQGRYDEAEDLLRRALTIQTQHLGRAHLDTAGTLNDLALVVDNQGDPAGAVVLYREALAVQRRAVGMDHPQVALTLHNLGCALFVTGDLEAARERLGEALVLRRRLLPSGHPRTTETLANLSVVLTDLGNPEAALPLAREALANRRQLFEAPHVQIGHSLYVLAYVLEKSEHLDEAEATYREALAAQRGSLPASHPAISRSLAAIGGLKLLVGQPASAEPLLRETLEIRRRVLASDHPLVLRAAIELGECLVLLQQPSEGENLLREAYEGFRGQDETRARKAAEALVNLYESTGEVDQADKFRALAAVDRSAEDLLRNQTQS